jgi:hypothetical protein
MRGLLPLFWLSAAMPALGQSAAPDSVAPPWYRLHHVALQTAGGAGVVSGGVGFVAARDRLETDILVGYVPDKLAGSALSIATVKLLYSPYTVPLGQKFQLRPLTVGMYLSYTHGTINDEEPFQYTKGYYWFSTDTRVGLLLGGRLSYLAPRATNPGRTRRISAYYELGTNDLYLASYVPNIKGMNFTEILTLGLGLKMDL